MQPISVDSYGGVDVVSQSTTSSAASLMAWGWFSKIIPLLILKALAVARLSFSWSMII
jgi:hypothetical protein